MAESDEGESAPKSGSEDGKPDGDDWFVHLRAGSDDKLKTAIFRKISKIVADHKLSNYNVLLLYDAEDDITSFHSDRLYAAASGAKDKKDILLVVHSNGGSIEPAYLISKTLKRLATKSFVTVVPRRAKSAATLISLGADEIHMGLMSQLGPIDPQVGGLPALAVGNALDVIADLAVRFPQAVEMFSKYLTNQVSIRTLGFYERISESAAQYAERLFNGRELAKGRTPNEVANYLVKHYKDHGFVIDFDEAKSLLGDDIVKFQTKEYALADEIYRFLDMVSTLLRPDKYLYIVGDVDYWSVSIMSRK